MGLGVSGWLYPDGSFHPNDSHQHYRNAQEIMQRNGWFVDGEKKETEKYLVEMKQYIPLGNGVIPYIHFEIVDDEVSVTPAQMAWFVSNYDKLCDAQKRAVGFYIHEWRCEIEHPLSR